ncbi:MAG: leucine-rich repeat protein [Bacteroidaceae bacterium]|nr:leucine-rich repeat protein [Bacteroidaceae bacterium]
MHSFISFLKRSASCFITTLLLCVSSSVSAHDFEANNNGTTFYFNLAKGGNAVEITFQGTHPQDVDDEYKGEIIIPSAITYEGNTYPVTAIGEGAFQGCAELITVHIPASVTSIQDRAFLDCKRLTSIFYNLPASEVFPISETTFLNVNPMIILNVPGPSRLAFRREKGWASFTNIISTDEFQEAPTLSATASHPVDLTVREEPVVKAIPVSKTKEKAAKKEKVEKVAKTKEKAVKKEKVEKVVKKEKAAKKETTEKVVKKKKVDKAAQKAADEKAEKERAERAARAARAKKAQKAARKEYEEKMKAEKEAKKAAKKAEKNTKAKKASQTTLLVPSFMREKMEESAQTETAVKQPVAVETHEEPAAVVPAEPVAAPVVEERVTAPVVEEPVAVPVVEEPVAVPVVETVSAPVVETVPATDVVGSVAGPAHPEELTSFVNTINNSLPKSLGAGVGIIEEKLILEDGFVILPYSVDENMNPNIDALLKALGKSLDNNDIDKLFDLSVPRNRQLVKMLAKTNYGLKYRYQASKHPDLFVEKVVKSEDLKKY